MSSTVSCDCGEVIRAESGDELVSAVSAHVERARPELVGKLGRDDILAMAGVDEQ